MTKKRAPVMDALFFYSQNIVYKIIVFKNYFVKDLFYKANLTTLKWYTILMSGSSFRYLALRFLMP